MFSGILPRINVMTLPRYLIIIKLIASHIVRVGIRLKLI
jgi:hypothetical protein